MTISISIPEDLAEQIREEAERQHRSFSGQVAFFCALGVRDLTPPEPTADEPAQPAEDTEDSER